MPRPSPASAPLEVRRAGVLLHITSLPGGDLGPSAYEFVDFLARAGCTVWQVLPLVPTHAEDRSPYNGVSAMAGNPGLISLDQLAADGLVEPGHQAPRSGKLDRATQLVLADRGRRADFQRWRAHNAGWLDHYVQFVALREWFGDVPWTSWKPELRDRDPAALEAAFSRIRSDGSALAERVDALALEQWLFAQQWQRLRSYAAERGVLLFGDLPIFVSHDSADVWANRDLFLLDETGHPSVVTGVPPDYFAADGQRWNNPHYDWDRMAEDGFGWWRQRIRAQRDLFDLVRIDHFRGFAASWHVPADAATARDGRWVPTPGRQVLPALLAEAGAGRLVAEDLGNITPEVVALRDEFGLPGMKVLQFAFDGNPDNVHLPAQHAVDAVVYPGTHDNDTTLGWWRSLDRRERRVVRSHLPPGQRMPGALVRLALASPAALAVLPAQDLLGLGSQARMNRPGSAEGNWSWRAPAGAFDGRLARRLRRLLTETRRV